MKYVTNCTEIGLNQVDDLDLMIENGQEIEYNELLEHVSQDQLDEVFPIYVGMEDVLSLESDYAVSYYKSTFRGKPCVYVCHSLIEYIFTS